MKLQIIFIFVVSALTSFSSFAADTKTKRKPNSGENNVCGVVKRVEVGRSGTSYIIADENGTSSLGLDAKTANYNSFNSSLISAYISGKQVCSTADNGGNMLTITFGE